MKQQLTGVEYIKLKLLGDEYWYENLTFDNIFEQAKEIEKEQKIEFAKLHVQKALKAVENEMILSASAVKHWYLPETIK